MERIKQALERARSERDTPGSLTGPVGTSDRARREEAPALEGSITYTQTRVLPIQRDVLRSHRIMLDWDNNAVTQAYKMLRTQVLQRMIANQWRSLAVTSAGKGAGKTVTAINLALSLAREVNHTVLLVDLDLRHPNIHNCLGIKSQFGISDFLLHDASLPEMLINPGIDRLVVLPGREPIFNSSEMLRSPKMVRLIDELKSRYPQRLVICDLPPLLAADDALAFSPYVDAVLLVIEEGRTRRADIEKAQDLLAETNVIGTVLNKSDEPGHPIY